MLQAVHPLTFILVAILPKMNTVAPSFAILPFAYVAIAMHSSPDAMSNFLALNPLSIVDFTLHPFVDTLPMRSVFLEFAFVSVACLIAFEAFAPAQIFFPLSFVDTQFIMIDHDTETMSLAILKLTFVDRTFIVLFDVKVILAFQSFIVE